MGVVHHLGIEIKRTNLNDFAPLQAPDSSEWNRESLAGRLAATRHVAQYHHVITVSDNSVYRVLNTR